MSQKQQSSEKLSTSNWMEDGKKLLSLIMSDDKAKPLIDSFYDSNNNTNSASIKTKINLKQIQDNLLNSTYSSMDALFVDITILLSNAMQIFNNSQNIVELNQIFIKYKDEYQSKSKSKSNDGKSEDIENELNEDEDEDIDEEQDTDLTETEQEQSDKTVTVSTKRKTRMHHIVESSTNTSKRRRSARLAKMKGGINHDSDNEPDIDICIGINFKKTTNKKRGTHGHLKKKNILIKSDTEPTQSHSSLSSLSGSSSSLSSATSTSASPPSQRSVSRKRNYNAMISDDNDNDVNNDNEGEISKIAKLSPSHTSPGTAARDMLTNTTNNASNTSNKAKSASPKKRNRRPRRRKNNNNNNTNNVTKEESKQNEKVTEKEHSENNEDEREKIKSKISDLSINITTESDENVQNEENNEDDDVEMHTPNIADEDEEEIGTEIKEMPVIDVKSRYNLRNRNKHKLRRDSLSKSPSKSKTPIAPSLSPKKQNKKTRKPKLISDKERKKQRMEMLTQDIIANDKTDDENDNDKEVSCESTINFEDGTQDSLMGNFDGHPNNMRYSCRALCINGEFKPFNQDWISLDRFDQFKGNDKPIIFCGVYDGHGILGHNSSKYCARHLPKEFIMDYHEIKNQQKPKYKQLLETTVNLPQDTHSIASTTTSTTANLSLDAEPETDSAPNDEQDEEKKEENEKNQVFFDALKQSLAKVDAELREIAENETTMFSTILQRQGCESRLIDYGTTVNCLISDGYDAYVINVGDSRCLLIEGKPSDPIHKKTKTKNRNNRRNKWLLSYKQISSDHNPAIRVDEQERVRNDGGQFWRQAEELRLFPKDKTFKEARRKGLAINMTRAVGHATLCNHGLIAVPECYHVKIEPDHEYIFVMASDGLWDVVQNEEVFEIVQSIYNTFIHSQTNQTIEDEICMELLEAAEKKWRKKRVGDNISIVCSRIVKNQK